MNPDLTFGLKLVASFAIGYFAWGGESIVVAPLVVMVWAWAKNKLQAGFIAFAYYLAGSRSVPAAAEVFFGESADVWLGPALWVGSAFILALVWGLAWGKKWIALRLLLALVVVSVPPVGMVGWLNPALGAASLFPGLGLMSFVLGISAMATLASFVRRKVRSWLKVSTASILSALAYFFTGTGGLPQAPDGWVAVQTNSGPPPNGFVEKLVRNTEIAKTVFASIRDGGKVIVLPEQHAGQWDKHSKIFFESSLGALLRETGASLIFGAATSHPEKDGKTFNSAMIYDGWEWDEFRARVVVPFSMYRPWSKTEGVEIEFSDGLKIVRDNVVAFSMCYEDMMIWPMVASALKDSPSVIISMVNGWWVESSGADLVQRQHIEAWSKIMGVPLVRSVNGSGEKEKDS
jgi:hypothetical protein